MAPARRVESIPGAVDYAVVDRAGRGGVARVFQAVGPDGRVVALKLLDAGATCGAHHRGRFGREARALRGIEHSGVLHLLDVGERDGRPCLVTEFVDGRPLDRIIDAEAPFEPRRAVRLAVLVLDALAAVHRAGFVHRDVKPGNVIVETDASGREWIRLVDFGAAAATHDAAQLAEPVGTPRYMAPEQATGGSLDPRADLFALGATLYEMLAGRPALPTRTVASILAGDVTAQPEAFDPRLEIAPTLAALVHGAMSPAATARPDAAGLRDALRAVLADIEPDRTLLTLDTRERTRPPVYANPAARRSGSPGDDPSAPIVMRLTPPR